MAAAKKARGFTLVELLVVITIIGMLMALLLPAIQSAREAGRRNTCSNNMRQAALAMINFEGNKKNFPGYANIVNGKRASWVVPILPYMERNDLYQLWMNNAPVTVPVGATGTILNPSATPQTQVSNPWAYTELNILECPSNPKQVDGANANPLSFIVNCGSARNADDNNPVVGTPPVWVEDPNSGVFFNHCRTGVSTAYNPASTAFLGGGPKVSQDFISNNDGTSYTLMMSENLNSSNWATDPTTDPAIIDPLTVATTPWQSDYQIKANTGFVWFFTGNANNLDPTQTAFSGVCNPSAKLINGFAQSHPIFMPLQYSTTNFNGGLSFSRPSSQHPGGANVVFCDGHLTFLAEELPYHVYTQLMSPRGKQVVVDRPANLPPVVTSSKATAQVTIPVPWSYTLSEADY